MQNSITLEYFNSIVYTYSTDKPEIHYLTYEYFVR